MYSKKFTITNPNSHNYIYKGAVVNVQISICFVWVWDFFSPNTAFNVPTLGSFLVDFVGFSFRTLGVVGFGFFICKVEKDLSNMLLIWECE